MSYDRAEFASSKFVNAMGIRRMYSLLERIFDRSAHLPTISMARHMMSYDDNNSTSPTTTMNIGNPYLLPKMIDHE